MGLFVGFHGIHGAKAHLVEEVEEFVEIHLPMAQGEVVIPGSVVVVEVYFCHTVAQEVKPLA
jgi:predicted hydrocarbon binding protein